jgi:hypothetical protein
MSSQFRGPAALNPGKEPLPVPTGLEVAWALEPVWTLWNTEISPALKEMEPQHVDRRYIDWAIPDHL